MSKEEVEEIILEPDPSRIMEGLRDTGYDFNTAMADIVDNSIAADAKVVKVKIDLKPDNTITVYANNINDDDTLTVYHDTKEGVTANLTLNRLGDDGMINDTNIVQQNNPILAQFDYSSLENGETVKQFGGYFRNEVSAGHYSGVMSYSIYINEN